jgi:hypothetical protein
MSCLSDVQIQTILDGEAVVLDKDGADETADAVRAHVASCGRCQMRVRERQTVAQAITEALSVPADLPPAMRARIERSLAEGSASGATRLRESPGARWPWTRVARRTAWSAAAVAAASLAAVVFVAPIVKEPSTVSAAEILAKSATVLAARASTGIEVLEYDLALDGVPREMMPDHADGVYRVKQIIDHDASGRYLIATQGPDGQSISSIAQDPATRKRVVAVLIDGQPYRFEFTVPGGVVLSPPEMERMHMQASVAMMQASGAQHLEVLDTPGGRRYRIRVPQVSAQTSTAMWDLTDAEVVIDATDYHVIEFAVKGTFLKQPYSVSYRLIARSVAARVSVDAFEVPRDPRAIDIEGEGSAIPARDMLVASLREYARMKRDGR